MEGKQARTFHRILARVVDYSLCALVLQSIAWSISPYLDPLYYLVGALCIPFLYIPLEVVQLLGWQTTLGKAIFGIRACEERREKLSFKGAFKAALSLFRKSSQISFVSSGKRKGKVLATLLTLVLTTGLSISNYIFPSSSPISSVAITSGWIKFVSKEAQFSVNFPAKPDCKLKEFPIPPAGITLAMTEYSSKTKENENEAYSVSYVTLPRSWLFAPSKKILLGALYLSYETQLGSDVLSKKLVSHWDRLPALDFIAKQNGKKIKGRIILSGGKLFQVSKKMPLSAKPTITPTSDQSSDDTFIESFNPSVR